MLCLAALAAIVLVMVLYVFMAGPKCPRCRARRSFPIDGYIFQRMELCSRCGLEWDEFTRGLFE